MKRLYGLLAAAGLAVPATVWAQVPPGWDVCWGGNCVAVPLDPWMTVATGVLLLLAALAVLRRRTGGALFMLAGAVAVAGYGVHEMKSAYAIISADLQITNSAGTQTLTCVFETKTQVAANGFGPTLTVLNTSGSPVTLFLTPLNGASLNWLTGIPGACQNGGVLPNNGSCFLLCTSPAPG